MLLPNIGDGVYSFNRQVMVHDKGSFKMFYKPILLLLLGLGVSLSASVYAQEEGYTPTAEEFENFRSAVENEPIRRAIRPIGLYHDYEKFMLLAFAVDGVDLNDRDAQIVDNQLREARLRDSSSKYQQEICNLLLSDNILFVDTETLKTAMVSGAEKIKDEQAASYQTLRRDLSGDGFLELDDVIEDELSQSTRTDTHPEDLFDRGAIVVKWMMKKKCEKGPYVPSEESSGAIRTDKNGEQQRTRMPSLESRFFLHPIELVSLRTTS